MNINPQLNQEKFTQCLAKYVEHCKNDKNWIEDELYKFRFSNWLFHKVNLNTQTPEKILHLCLESQRQRFDNRGRGIQFIITGAESQLSKPISMEDVIIFKELSRNGEDITVLRNYKRGMTYTAMTAWLGTLLPKQFICAPTSDFAIVLDYLFDSILPKSGFELFNQSLLHFKIIKEELKKAISADKYFFLEKLNEYLISIYSHSSKKLKYDEADWNWVTEDFALFVLLVHLNYKPIKKKKVINTSKKAVEIIENSVIDEDDNNNEDIDDGVEFETTVEGASNEDVSELESLIRLDQKYRNAEIEVKWKLSKIIERGSLAQKFKKVAGYKCMICEHLNKSPYGFLKEDSEYYIEVHHVIPVAEQIKGTLTSANLMTVCPNHHRQLHYGKNTSLVEVDDARFLFKLDGRLINIKKLPCLKPTISMC